MLSCIQAQTATRLSLTLSSCNVTRLSWRSIAVFPVNKFRNIVDAVDVTGSAYVACPLFQLTNGHRGKFLELLAREVYSQMHPLATVEDAPRGLCVNGSVRSIWQTECDWLCDGVRVECKSSQLMWDRSNKRWNVVFQNVKLHSFDQLFLVIYSPRKLFFFQHDRVLGLARNLDKTLLDDRRIRIAASTTAACWESALEQILCKLGSACNGCEIVRVLDVSHELVQQLLADSQMITSGEDPYKGIPLSSISSSLRGKRIEALVYEVDRLLHPSSVFGPPAKQESSFDWLRDGLRVECKHAKPCWDAYARVWVCQFLGIKFALKGYRSSAWFDELLLAVYTPTGIHIFRHNGSFGISSAGAASRTKGLVIKVYAARGVRDVAAALQVIFDKLQKGGCKMIAAISW
eukprot:TRINITY_DN5968_c0_g1_i1.p1 TRINITY_DN5968_c0_g1~~TRINITY_DN5968_c0_g1_i1.p1  ORF type:complete len:404 (-),score=50.69 TRINITY_DN5968_c0_g1_i1:136-1347(-)